MFIEATDLNSSMYPEIQQAISRGQEALVNQAINEALSYIQSRLATKYDIVAEFAKTDSARHPLLMKYAKDIAIYYLYALPENIPLKRVKAYEDAVKWLDDLNNGMALLAGVNPAPSETTESITGNIQSGTEEKRSNFF